MTWCCQGAGNWVSMKSNPNGVFPMMKAFASGTTLLQSGEQSPEQPGELAAVSVSGPQVRQTSEYGLFRVAQQGKPQSSPCPTRISFSRPPSAAL